MTAAQIARTLAASVCLVYFTKRDGSTRRMVTAPSPDGIALKGTMARVWDVEKGAYRTVNTATVTDLRCLASKPARRGTAPDRAPVPPARPSDPDRAARIAALASDFDSFGY